MKVLSGPEEGEIRSNHRASQWGRPTRHVCCMQLSSGGGDLFRLFPSCFRSFVPHLFKQLLCLLSSCRLWYEVRG